MFLSINQIKQISSIPSSFNLQVGQEENFDLNVIELSSKYIFVWHFVISSFLISYCASIFNSLLFTELKEKLSITDFQISISLVITLIGSCILLFVKTNNKKEKVPIKFSFFNLMFVLTVGMLLLVTSIRFAYIIMLFVGVFNSISSIYQMKYVACVDPKIVTIKVLHVFSEFFSVLAGVCFYFVLQNNFTIQFNLIGVAVLGISLYILSVYSIYLQDRNKFRIRIADGNDLEFLVDLYRECKDLNIGQSEFPENRKVFFKKNEKVSILLDPPIDGFTEFHYFIVENHKGLPVACVTNLRNDKRHEELGMLIRKGFRGKGLGKKTLLNIVELRKPHANRITGLIAETNVACIKASCFAGARILDTTKYEAYSNLFLNVEFYNKELL